MHLLKCVVPDTKGLELPVTFGGGGGGWSREKQVEEEKYGAKLELPGEADKVYLW